VGEGEWKRREKKEKRRDEGREEGGGRRGEKKMRGGEKGGGIVNYLNAYVKQIGMLVSMWMVFQSLGMERQVYLSTCCHNLFHAALNPAKACSHLPFLVNTLSEKFL
jgi:hypothetical protein